MAGVALALSFTATKAIEHNLQVHGGEAGTEGTTALADRDNPEPDVLPLSAYRQAIQGRNIFDSGDGSGTPWEPTTTNTGIDGIVLVATVVADREEQSSALIATGRGGDTLVKGYGRGDQLLDGARITAIDQGQVTLHSADGEIQRLIMGWKRAEL